MIYESEYYGFCQLPDNSYLMHHGIKGQKWGVRRFQYADGSLTPAGQRRYNTGSGRSSYVRNRVLNAYEKLTPSKDKFISSKVNLYRVQSNDKFENLPFYATYKKDDVDKYAGLFGKNLERRAKAAAKQSGEKVTDFNVNQLQLSIKSKLRVPSDKSAGHVVGNLVKDKTFKDDLISSISDSSKIMKRPAQQIVFNEALKALKKDSSRLTDSDNVNIYRALNVSLVNHNETQIRMQSKFYGELKKNGYSALIDLNDKKYSSYRAKSPVIVFDTSKVKFEVSRKLGSTEVNKLYKKYERKRVASETHKSFLDVPINIIGIKTNAAKESLVQALYDSDKKR